MSNYNIIVPISNEPTYGFKRTATMVSLSINCLPGKLAKKLQPILEQLTEDIDDLRIEHCNKENNKITRDAQGNYEFTADGERAFKKAHKELLSKEVEFDFTPLSYAELCQVLPADFAKQNPWEVVGEVLEPFYFYA